MMVDAVFMGKDRQFNRRFAQMVMDLLAECTHLSAAILTRFFVPSHHPSC
jgi:hypothetical protein